MKSAKPAAKPKPVAKPAAKVAAKPKPIAKPAAKSITKVAAKPAPTSAKPAAKSSAKPTAKPAPSKPAAKPAPTSAKPAPSKPAAAPSTIAKAKPAKPAKESSATVTVADPAADVTAPQSALVPRFGFLAIPIVRDASGLTDLLRRQLVVDTLLSTGRTTTPDRIPTTYFSPGIVRWRVTAKGLPIFDVVQNTAFFPDSDEGLGLERVQGSWTATARATMRGISLDLTYLAWELNRDWPGRRLPLGPEPQRGGSLAPSPIERDQPWPPGTTFV